MKSPLTNLKIISLIAILGQVIFHHKPAQAATFSDLYVFGDSSVDEGNYYDLTGQPGEPYSEGRFSNGKLFVELIPEKLGFTYNSDHNYAVAGATINSHALNDAGTVTDRDLGFDGQVRKFVEDSKTVDDQALYVISIGGNDYLKRNFDLNSDGKINKNDSDQVIANLTTSVQSLVDAGAKNFLVVSLFDYTKTPLLSNSADFTAQQKKDISSLIGEHNQRLQKSLSEISEIKFKFFDLNKALAENVEEFTNIEDSCLTTDLACETPGEYLFWDAIHPTASANEIIADEVVKILKASDGKKDDLIATAVPEPLTLLGVGTAVSFGVFFKRKRSSLPATDDGELSP